MLLSTLLKNIPARALRDRFRNRPQDGQVFVRVMGGLGNQLFQYAFAQYLAHNGVQVAALQADVYGNPDRNAFNRSFLLDNVSTLPFSRRSPSGREEMRMLTSEDGDALLALLLLPENAKSRWLCNGYWQRSDYVDTVRDVVLQGLQRQQAKSAVAKMINAPECSLHVRRSNYGQNGLIPVSYYLDCLEEAAWPHFRVVTDEPNFCNAMFRNIKGFTGVVSSNQADPWKDFFALSTSPIQIIANSSFSWWSGWLGQNSGVTTKVFAPGEWSILTENNPCLPNWPRIAAKLLRP